MKFFLAQLNKMIILFFFHIHNSDVNIRDTFYGSGIGEHFMTCLEKFWNSSLIPQKFEFW